MSVGAAEGQRLASSQNSRARMGLRVGALHA